MTEYLSRDQILKTQDLETKDVEVPEWGGTVRVRSLTGKERSVLEDLLFSANGSRASRSGFRERLVAMATVNENGEQLFTDADVKELGEKNWAVLERVATVVLDLSALSRDSVDELVGKSETTPTGGSTSG